MATIEEIKEKVGRLVAEKKLSYNAISISLGKNPSYLQKFVKEKSPKRLDEGFRRELARILNVDEQELTDLPLLPSHMVGVSTIADKVVSLFNKKEDMATIEMVNVTACCGNGIDNLSEQAYGYWKLPLAEFKSLAACNPKDVKMIKAQGDSMSPTISDGDFVWIDLSNNFISSDGIYLIKTHAGLSIKRIQSGLTNITVLCDNSKYNDEVTTIGEIQIVGKVVHVLNSRRV